MSDKMKVSCIQMDMDFCSPEKNYKKVELLIVDALKNKPDVIVLPEMWNTGFFPRENLEEYCDIDGQKTKTIIGGLAKKHNVNIVAGSIANKKGSKVYNTAYIFDRQGEIIGEYDKIHLFSPMDEDKYFTKGDNICTFTLDGKNCGIIICYDIRFPELTRTMALKGLDCMFVVSQWPDVRIAHLQTLVKSRAIENQMYVVCCNSCSKAENVVYGGSSMVVSPWGEEIVVAENTEQVITAEIDYTVVENIRKSINVFSDRRNEIYELN